MIRLQQLGEGAPEIPVAGKNQTRSNQCMYNGRLKDRLEFVVLCAQNLGSDSHLGVIEGKSDNYILRFTKIKFPTFPSTDEWG